MKLAIVVAALFVACAPCHDPEFVADDTGEAPECQSRTMLYERVVSHVGGGCGHMGYPRLMEPVEGVELVQSRECGVYITSWLDCEQLSDLYVLRFSYHEAESIWEEWFMTLETDEGSCIERYRIDYEPT